MLAECVLREKERLCECVYVTDWWGGLERPAVMFIY